MFDSQSLLERFHRGEYAVVMADIDAAWETTHAEASRQIEAGEEPWGMVECLRIALLESGMRSWAATRTPSIVARAVEVGLWTPERANALIGLIPETWEERRAALSEALTGNPYKWTVPLVESSYRGVSEVCEAAKEISNDEDRYYAFHFLLQLLPKGAYRDVVESAIIVTSGIWWRDGLLNPVAQYLDGKWLAKALYAKHDYENGSNFTDNILMLVADLEDEAAQAELMDYVVQRIFSARNPIYTHHALEENRVWFTAPHGLEALRRHRQSVENAYERAKWMPKYDSQRAGWIRATLRPFIEYLRHGTAIVPTPIVTPFISDSERLELFEDDLYGLSVDRRKGRHGLCVNVGAYSSCIRLAFARAFMEADGDDLGSWSE